MGRLTRGARYRLPPGQFQDGDLVINIDPPQDKVYNLDTPIHPTPSQHTDDDRFGRHRRHLLQEYGHDKLKFADDDNATGPSDDQERIRDVYGWYEVSEWPGAKQRLKDTDNFLARLRGEKARPRIDSSPDPFDNSEEDETFQPDDDGPLLPSEAQTIEEDINGAVYVPSPVKVQYPNPQVHAPTLGAFTPVKASRRRFKKPKSVKKQMSESAARRNAYSEKITRGLASAPVSTPEPRRDAAIEVLARLDEALQVRVDKGLVSPHSKRSYTKRELDLRRRSAGSGAPIDPVLLDDEADRDIQPRFRAHRTSHAAKKRKSQQEPLSEDDETVVTMPKKKRRSTRMSQVSIYDANQDETGLDATRPKPGQKVYPPLNDPGAEFPLWPQYEEAASNLPEGYQVRVRFVPDADHILTKYRKEQAQEIEVLVSDLVNNVIYYLLTLPNWRAAAAEKGLDELKSQARNYILMKLKEIEKIWIKMFNDLNVKFILPSADNKDTCPRLTAPLHKRNKANTGNNHTLGIPSLTSNPRRKQPKFLPTPATNQFTAKDSHLSYSSFVTDVNILLTRQVTALLETVRFQTCTPKALWQRQSAKGTAQRRLYESNMRVAALAWQVGFFEGWAREIGRLRMRSVQKLIDEGAGEMRFWKQEVFAGRTGEWEVVDLMTGVREPLRQWQKKHGLQIAGHEEDDPLGNQPNDHEEEEGAIARSIRKAKETSTRTRPGRRARASHDRLQAVMNRFPPNKNLDEHNQLQAELRRHQQQDQLRQNRCSRTYGMTQPLDAQSPSLYVPGAIIHVNRVPLTPTGQWEFAQDLSEGGGEFEPRTGRYVRPGSQTQCYNQHVDAGTNSGVAYMPLDPALQAIDVHQQQRMQSWYQTQGQQQYPHWQTATQLRAQQQMQAQYQLPTPTTPPGFFRDASATVVGDGEQIPVATHGEMSMSPHHTTGVRLCSSPTHEQKEGPSAEQSRMFYPSSPLAGTVGRSPSQMPAGPSSPLMFVRDLNSDGHLETKQHHGYGNERAQELRQDTAAKQVPNHNVLRYLPDNATLAQLRESFERVGRTADAAAIRALERGGSVVVGADGQLVVHENYNYGNSDVDMSMGQDEVTNVNGDFGTNDLGETGETEEEAKRRSIGHGFEGWKEMLVGGD